MPSSKEKVSKRGKSWEDLTLMFDQTCDESENEGDLNRYAKMNFNIIKCDNCGHATQLLSRQQSFNYLSAMHIGF
jgi:hypothetical protein